MSASRGSDRLALARAALAYARRGWAVLPCVPRDKRPHPRLAPRGFHDATADLVRVDQWWQLEPQANIGVVPGRSTLADGGSLLVIDLDGPTGLEAADGLGVPRGTAAVTTGRTEGGEHRYFKVPAMWDGAPLRIGNRALAASLDVRHAAGYVLAPPSVHPTGTPYRWRLHNPRMAPKGDHVFAPLPDALLERLTASASSDMASPMDRRFADDSRATSKPLVGAPYATQSSIDSDNAERWRRARAYVAKVDTGLADARQRTAFRLAAALLHDFQLGDADVCSIVSGWNARNRPALPDEKLAAILINARRYGGKAREMRRGLA